MEAQVVLASTWIPLAVDGTIVVASMSILRVVDPGRAQGPPPLDELSSSASMSTVMTKRREAANPAPIPIVDPTFPGPVAAYPRYTGAP
ncbi:hypothetical protein [Nonomuraea sp. SYSU D8015]|uniref:hypothetical protein n=1 Tax=Nonomuraea sp. SYSU D8015 TaxID=2593644 RepID=UPI001661531E|nr:hypothetical protein [Nonomuraea sp. SYSU D8015]